MLTCDAGLPLSGRFRIHDRVFKCLLIIMFGLTHSLLQSSRLNTSEYDCSVYNKRTLTDLCGESGELAPPLACAQGL